MIKWKTTIKEFARFLKERGETTSDVRVGYVPATEEIVIYLKRGPGEWLAIAGIPTDNHQAESEEP